MPRVTPIDEPQTSGPPVAFQAEDGEHAAPAPSPRRGDGPGPAAGYQADNAERPGA